MVPARSRQVESKLAPIALAILTAVGCGGKVLDSDAGTEQKEAGDGGLRERASGCPRDGGLTVNRRGPPVSVDACFKDVGAPRPASSGVTNGGNP